MDHVLIFVDGDEGTVRALVDIARIDVRMVGDHVRRVHGGLDAGVRAELALVDGALAVRLLMPSQGVVVCAPIYALIARVRLVT